MNLTIKANDQIVLEQRWDNQVTDIYRKNSRNDELEAGDTLVRCHNVINSQARLTLHPSEAPTWEDPDPIAEQRQQFRHD